MALVRCPKHDIPFNDENPRGCPACAQEKEGRDSSSVMRELARASQAGRRSSGMQSARILEQAAEQFTAGLPSVTTQPRAPFAEPTGLERITDFARRRPIYTIGIPLIAVAVASLLFRSGPSFIEQPDPPPATGEPRPLAVEPGSPLATVFSILGVQPPRTNPESRTLERYVYGTDLTVDALNGAVYAIALGVPTVAWRGLRVGLSQRNAEGTLALLGPPSDVAPPTAARADTIRGYLVYPSLDTRPLRTLRAEVRPPNGCLDVSVDLRPRAAGVIADGEHRYAAIGPPAAPLEWVVTRVLIVNRAVAGPSGGAAC